MPTIFPLSASVGQVFNGYEFNGTSWNIIGIDLTEDYVTEDEFDAYKLNTIKTYIQDEEPDFEGMKAIWVETGLGIEEDKFSIWINT
jgi:hypothetical protein